MLSSTSSSRESGILVLRLGVTGDASFHRRAGPGSVHMRPHGGGRVDLGQTLLGRREGSRAAGCGACGTSTASSIICFLSLGSSLAPLLSYVSLSPPLGPHVTSSSSVPLSGGGVGVRGGGRGRRERGASHWLEAVLEGRERDGGVRAGRETE